MPKILFFFVLLTLPLTLAVSEPYSEEAKAIFLKPDGKIVISGYSMDGDVSNLQIFKIQPDGGYDSSFGTQGRATFNAGNGRFVGDSLIVYPDNKIVVAAQGEQNNTVQLNITRFLDNGNIDPSFGKEGKAALPLKSSLQEGQSSVVQSDGKIVVAGSFAAGSVKDLSLSRLGPDGNYDPTFGTQGRVVTRISGVEDKANGVALQSDGKILITGYYVRNGAKQMLTARFTKDGKLDPSFGTGGGAFTDWMGLPSQGWGVAVQRDKKIIVVGELSQGKNGQIAVARFLDNGTLDNSFGTGGRIAVDIGPADDRGTAVAVQSDGKIVVLGDSDNGNSRDFVVLRILPNGALDPNFANAGKRIIQIKDNSIKEVGFKKINPWNFEISGAYVSQIPGGTSYSGELAWTPQYWLNEGFGVKLYVGVLPLISTSGTNFLSIDYGLTAIYKPSPYFAIEEGLGAQTWVNYGGTSFAFTAQIDWFMGKHLKIRKPFFQKLLNRLFFNYTLLTDAIYIHQLRAGIGVNF